MAAKKYFFRSEKSGRNESFRAPPHSGDLLGAIEGLRTNWFWSSDASGRLTYVSDWLCDEFAASPEHLLKLEITDVLKLEDCSDEAGKSFGLTLARRKPFRGLNARSPYDPAERIWTVSGNPCFDAKGDFAGYRGVGSDVTAVQDAADEISRLASYDSLTGLRNRRGTLSLVNQALAAAVRQATPFSILLVDLDRFKQINDTLGHPAGDLLLVQVAERLTRVVGEADRVGRLGGDEFQIVLENQIDREALSTLASEIIRALSQPYSVNGARCVIGASIGIVVSMHGDITSDELIRDADLALYAAKSAGRGRFRFFSQDMLEEAADRRLLEQDLLDALDRGELEVNYQPLVHASTNFVSCLEALLRWNHPRRGRISPALFIPIAEEANLISRLGEWVLRRACEDAAQWPQNVRVAVNVSPIQFANPQLPQMVMSALAHSGLAPARLELEITESVFLNDGKDTDQTFASLKKIGVRLALDDFGTGYSSLGYLKTAPFDKIKIDQSFVRGSGDPASRNNAIITSIVALARALDMETTAEGIETLDQLETMRALEVSHIQGYLYSLPVSAETVSAMIGDGQWEIRPAGPAKQRENRVTTFRRIGAVHGDHYYPIILRNLSSTGALIEGIVDVPVGTRFVIDFGDRQWVVATVRRSRGDLQGVEFEERLVSDDEGGYRARYRVSSLMMSQLGLVQERAKERPEQLPGFQQQQSEFPLFRSSIG